MPESQDLLPGLTSELEEGEPVFILRARDPLAPHMAALWAALRKGDTASALSIFSDTVSDPAYKYRQPGNYDDTQKVHSASNKAKEMNRWRENKGLEAFGLYTV